LERIVLLVKASKKEEWKRFPFFWKTFVKRGKTLLKGWKRFGCFGICDKKRPKKAIW